MIPRHASPAVFAVVGLLAVGEPAAAQFAAVAGKVTDDQGQPVAGAAVVLEGRGKHHTTTNDSGDFFFVKLLQGHYVVTAAKDGVGIAQSRAEVSGSALAGVNLTLRRPAASVDAWCAPIAATRAHAFVAPATSETNPQVARLLRWIEAVEHHVPGCSDAAVREVGSWSRPDVDAVFTHIARLATFLHEAAELEARDPVAARAAKADAAASRAGRHQAGADPNFTIEVGDQSFTIFEVRRFFQGNATLKRGAVLHADIAAFVRDDFSRRSVFVQDGQQKGAGGGTAHWGFGRRLLDSIMPSPDGDADALLWYRASSAYLFREGLMSELPAHLAKARRVFSGQSVFLIDSGYLHQKLASPGIQAAVPELRAAGISVDMGSRRAELQRAEQFFRQALAAAPGNANVLLRLGHTLGDLGRHEQAAQELRKAVAAASEPDTRYLAELFLGREEQALGNRDEAGRRFERAATLFPNAQSPWIAISHLARQRSDRAGALRALQRVTVLKSSKQHDPRWFFYEPHQSDALPLMDQLRKIGGGPVP